MKRIEIVDFHTHAFPSKIVERAMETLSKTSGHMIPCADGTKEGLLSLMDECGVDRSVVLSIATNAAQMKSVNDYAIAIDGGRLISFGSVFPWADNAVEELYRLRENGIRGVKFHPEYQDFFVDDDTLAPMYEAVRKLNLIAIFHAGMDNAFTEPVKASPRRLAAMLPAFGASPVVLSHMGGYILWREVLDELAGGPAYFDTSFCFSRIPLPLCKQIIKKHGTARVLFGSDAPWSNPENERRLIDALDLPEADRMAVLGGNAIRLLGL